MIDRLSVKTAAAIELSSANIDELSLEDKTQLETGYLAIRLARSMVAEPPVNPKLSDRELITLKERQQKGLFWRIKQFTETFNRLLDKGYSKQTLYGTIHLTEETVANLFKEYAEMLKEQQAKKYAKK